MSPNCLNFDGKTKCNIARIICVTCTFHLRWALCLWQTQVKKTHSVIKAIVMEKYFAKSVGTLLTAADDYVLILTYSLLHSRRIPPREASCVTWA